MGDEHDSWLGPLGVDIGQFASTTVQTVENAIPSAVAGGQAASDFRIPEAAPDQDGPTQAAPSPPSAPPSDGGFTPAPGAQSKDSDQGGSSQPSPSVPSHSPGLDTDDFKQGYQDGVSGGDANPIPRDGDALTDYEEGYAKGHHEFLTKKEEERQKGLDELEDKAKTLLGGFVDGALEVAKEVVSHGSPSPGPVILVPIKELKKAAGIPDPDDGA